MNAAAQELTWYDETGQVSRVAELQGKVVLLNFWATWCAP
jgi:thiol-disulfide isomerase/thioredoxin